MAPILEARQLSFGYQKAAKIFYKVSFSMQAGQILTILGPNGAGKSTLLGCLAGMRKPDEGQLLLGGKAMGGLSNRKIARQISYVQQSEAAVFGYTVQSYIVMGRAPYISSLRLPSKADYQLVYDTMEQMGILHLADKPYHQISGGERQQAAIARAIVQQPSLIILDEPTSALDYGNQTKVIEMIRQLAQKGYAVIMTTHNPEHAILLDDTVGILARNGEFVVGSAAQMICSQRLSELYEMKIEVAYMERLQRRVCIAGA